MLNCLVKEELRSPLQQLLKHHLILNVPSFLLSKYNNHPH